MNRTQELIQVENKFGAHNYHPLDVVLQRGLGAKVWDIEGKEYLDFLACYSALNFGHQHPKILKALQDQVTRLSVCSRAFHSEELCHFTQELSEFCGLECVLPMNSGTEAVETALKIARRWGYRVKGIPAHQGKIIALKNNFHGRSITIVSFSSEDSYRRDFGPFTEGFQLVEFGNFKALEAAIDGNTAAVLVEPIQAEAGILVPPAGYLKQVRDLCDQKNVLFLADEIQTGMGRTGRDFCCQHDDVTPDIYILGKSLGGGMLPLSAVVAKRQVMDVLGPGEHGSTFGGNPLASAVGRVALKVLKEEKLSARAAHLGELAFQQLKKASLPKVKEVRGKGALLGIELTKESGGARRYCERLLAEGVLCKETHDYVIRIAPPLVISESDLALGLGKIIKVIQTL